MYEIHETKPPRKRKGKKGKSLSGMSEQKREMLVGAAKPLFIVAGLWAGNMAGKLIDKAVPAPTDENFHFVSLVKPTAQLGAGITIAWLCRDKKQDTKQAAMLKEFARNLGYGVAGSGIISGAKLLKKDLFEGLGNTPTGAEQKPVEAKYYTEAKDEIMRMLQDNSFRPELSEGHMHGTEETTQDSILGNEEVSGAHLSEHTVDAHAEIL